MSGKHLDEGTLTAIFDEFAPALYKYVLRLCHDPDVGDNIVGDAFAGLLEQFATGKDPPSDPRLFLYQTVYSSIVKYLRESQHDPSVERVPSASEKPDTKPSLPQDDEQVMKEGLFSALYHELAEDQRHVMILHFLEDFSIEETAKISGKKVDEIKVSLRGIQKLMNNHPELPTEPLSKKKKKRKPK